ncbi:MAG: hypothetical protein VX647_09560, partial [Pseudomonadota bacterium]|nr:hypothetical protein [Pseudomonadota bacterium]
APSACATTPRPLPRVNLSEIMAGAQVFVGKQGFKGNFFEITLINGRPAAMGGRGDRSNKLLF